MGNIVSSLIMVPKELITQRMQAGAKGRSWQVFLGILRNYGIVGLYAGYSATLLRNLPAGVFSYSSFEYLKAAMLSKKSEKTHLEPAESVICGALAGAISATLTTPLDVVKTRLMTQAAVEKVAAVMYSGVVDTARLILKEEAGSYLHDDEDDFNDDTDGEIDADNEEDAFDVHAGEEGSNATLTVYSSDEAFARALQDAEEREMAARLLALAGFDDHDDNDDDDEEEDSEPEEHGDNSQDAWEEVDPDELSYEELLALGEVVGTQSRGLSPDTIATLPSVNYKTGSSQHGSNDSCVICRLDYEDDETLTLLSCKHSYHPECINNWLNINKVCPVCSTEVSTSENS